MTYQNTLEQWYSSAPGPVQQVVSWSGLYDKANDCVKWIAGDPDQIMSYAPRYTELGTQVSQTSQEIETIAQGIEGWTGESHDTFLKKACEFAEKIDKIAEAVKGTPEVLEACAQGAVEVANCIIDIVKMVIEFLITSLAVSAALSVFTFGASVAAWVAANLAKGAQALAKVVQVAEKFARFLEKMARLFQKIAEVFNNIAEIIKVIKEVFQAVKAIKGGGLVGFAAKKAVTVPISIATSKAANAVLPGSPMPSGVGEAMKAGQDGYDAWQQIQQARDAASQNMPPQ
ncbi:MAG: hypothetical protein Q4G45_13790 [Actinomycetia bacterium]|nr:hypothetical protein [Actinomycetes bacterium]